MLLLVSGLGLAVITSFAVRRAAARGWHYAAIAALAVALMPLLATTITGDVSRHLPAAMFSDGPDGKDDVVMASVAATVLLALLFAATAFGTARLVWRRTRQT